MNDEIIFLPPGLEYINDQLILIFFKLYIISRMFYSTVEVLLYGFKTEFNLKLKFKTVTEIRFFFLMTQRNSYPVHHIQAHQSTFI